MLGELRQAEGAHLSGLKEVFAALDKEGKLWLLRLALLLHDIGKKEARAKDEIDHAQRGFDISAKILRWLNIEEKDEELIRWLILHHQSMDYVTQHQAMAPGTFTYINYIQRLNKWHGMAKEMLGKTEREIREWEREIVENAQDKATAYLRGHIPNDVIGMYFKEFINPYEIGFLVYFEPILLSHIEILAELARSKGEYAAVKVLAYQEAYNKYYQVVVGVTPDRKGLLEKITGVLLKNGVNIERARIRTSRDKRFVLDTFWILKPEKI